MKKSQLEHHHDKAFKKAMSDLRVAKDFLQHHLPDSLKRKIDLGTLRIKKSSYIDKQLARSESDILYSVKTVDDRESYVYVLAEHQRQPDRWLPFRIVKYLCAICDEHRKQYPKDKQLPLVFPIVFYNGDKLYHHSMRFVDLFGQYKAEAIEIFASPFHLIDLNKISDEDLRGHQWSGLMEMVMKHTKEQDLLAFWKNLLEIFAEQLLRQEAGEEYLTSMVIYAAHEYKVVNLKHFFDTIVQELTKKHCLLGGKKMITIADQLREEGMQEGVQQGMQQGMQRGVQQGMQQGVQQERYSIAKRMLQKGQPIELIAEFTDLSVEELKKLVL